MNCLHSNAIFLGVEEPCGRGGAYGMVSKVTRWCQSALCATAVCSERVYSWLDALQVARTLTCLHGNTVSPGVQILVALLEHVAWVEAIQVDPMSTVWHSGMLR